MSPQLLGLHSKHMEAIICRQDVGWICSQIHPGQWENPVSAAVDLRAPTVALALPAMLHHMAPSLGSSNKAVYPFKASRKFSLQSAKTASYVRDSPFAMSEKRLWQIDCIQSPSTSQTFWDAEKILTRWTWTSSKTLACCLIVNSAISHSTDWPNFPIRPALITLGPHSSVFLESTRHTTASGSSSGCSTPPTTQTQGSLGVTQ